MSDETPSTRHVASDGLSVVERINLPLFLKAWNGLSDADRLAWADEYIWARRHHREHEAAAAQALKDAEIAEEKKAKDEQTARDRESERDRKINRRINIGIAVATLLVTGGSYLGTHAGPSPTTPQKIVVQFPNGQQVTVPTLNPSPTAGVIEP